MKKFLYIFIVALSISTSSFGQDDGGTKIREKMVDYIQSKLGLSKNEAEKFQPVFFDYLKDMRSTKQQFQGDKLILQQKIVELRIRYRDQFKPIIGDKRSNEVFQREKEFVDQVKQEIIDRRENQQEGRANKKSGLLQ